MDFELFRNEANHFLQARPQDQSQVEIINEFNALLEDCRSELSKELNVWDGIRLTRDDNEADPFN